MLKLANRNLFANSAVLWKFKYLFMSILRNCLHRAVTLGECFMCLLSSYVYCVHLNVYLLLHFSNWKKSDKKYFYLQITQIQMTSWWRPNCNNLSVAFVVEILHNRLTLAMLTSWTNTHHRILFILTVLQNMQFHSLPSYSYR